MSSGAETRPHATIKMLITGDSGTGKTGGLVSLILAGYKLRVIDIDNKIDIILHCLHHPKSPYFAAAQKLNLNDVFRYEVVNHKMITMDDNNRVRIQPAGATVWPRIQKLAHEWREAPSNGKPGVFLGPIASWGPDTVLVFDTFTFAGFAALFAAQELNENLGVSSGYKWMKDIGTAQDWLDTLLKLVCSDTIKCHVIINTHVQYMAATYSDNETKTAKVKQISGSASDLSDFSRAYPNAIGRALGPRIGAYFNNVIETKFEGDPGRSQRRRYMTIPSGAIAVKTSAPFALAPSYPIETGLADIFAALRGTTPARDRAEAAKTPTTPSTQAVP